MKYLDQTRRVRFPHPNTASPHGIVAQGGNLSPGLLLSAYEQGIFPWYEEEPILWFSPDPRFVLFLEEFHVGSRLERTIRTRKPIVTFDSAFDQVINACREPRRGSGGTWITNEMEQGYRELHSLGYAHSVEVWDGGQLAGGLYGVAAGGAFSGESMFTRIRDGSKFALIALVGLLDQLGLEYVDCQSYTRHLATFGARDVPRDLFLEKLEQQVRHRDKIPRRWSSWCGEAMLARGVEVGRRHR